MASIWITKRTGKRGVRYLVRWIEPDSGTNRGKTFRRPENARDFKAKLKRDFENNEYFAPVRIGYDEWVNRHLENLRSSPDIDLADKTIAGHKEALEYLKRLCNPQGPIDITPKMIRVFRLKLLDKGLAARTINKHIATIRSALSYAVRAELVPTNKLFGPHRLSLRIEWKPPRIMEVGKVTTLMNLAEIKLKTVISLAYYHGLRKGDICYLQWQDVDIEQLRLDIVNREDIHRTKKRNTRTIALRPESAKLLDCLYQDRVNEFVFTNPETFYHSSGRNFKTLVERAGIDHCTLHDLRKTCNTTMQDKGIPREVAMQVLGHTSAHVNQEYYTGVLTEQQRIAINSLPSIG
ncbi:MAG: hypothetical protein AMJ79_13200 [Phycisphaerae bacterium SM23_30]|nr:MAG: hypothetical protein AMJ79_13200 [Phycisphaerae bacterium SM23_30]